MNKKIVFVGLLFIAIGGVVFNSLDSKEMSIDSLRSQHAEFLKNHPFQKVGKLPKKQRKAQGLPPNAYFEQKYLSEINPNTGRTHKENIFELQKQLKKQRASQKSPGANGNSWVERGPDNVGGRTRALMFDPNDSSEETVFAGGVSGGLWKNTKISDAQSAWVRVGIPENLAVTCIVSDPNDSKIFYVGTGESYVNGDANGDGVWKSTDGGNTWSNIFGGIIGKSFLDTNSTLTINNPSSLAGSYSAVLTTLFGGELNSSLTNDLVLIDDGTQPNNDGCEAAINASKIKGKIAVIVRGTCNFSVKAKIAQDAGAVAVIIVNNNGTNPFNMAAGEGSEDVNIPALMISKTDGDKIISVLESSEVNVTLSNTNDTATNSTILPGIQHINDIAIRNNNGNSEIFVAAGESGYTGGVSLGGQSFGMYKSVDGSNFTKLNIPKTAGNNEHEPNDIEISPDNSVYVSTTRSFTFNDGGGVIFKSTNGTDFSKIYNVPNGVRTEIALSTKQTEIVYVLAQTSIGSEPVKIYKTTDDFENVQDLNLPEDADEGISAADFTRGQSFYDLLLRVDPNNQNVIYVGGIDLFKSTTGGNSWKQISKWSNNPGLGALNVPLVHADQHGLAFSPNNKLVFGNDGGVYYSSNSGQSISPRNKNYNTLQFYTVGVASTASFNNAEYFIAGAQDNGTQLISNATDGINSSSYAAGGDGAASFFDTDGTDQYYITNYVYNQAIQLYNYKTNQTITVNNEDTSNGDFINQEELDSNLNILYSNYSRGNNIVIKRYSNLLTNITKVDLKNQLMNAKPTTLKISPYTTNNSNLFVGLSNGRVLKVKKANIGTGNWENVTGPNFVGSVSDIGFGENEDQIFVTMHNYGVISVWYSDDAGATWMNKEGNLPDIPVKAILQNPLSRNEVIIGTDLGVWSTSNIYAENPVWKQSYNGMSNVPVLDLDLRDDNVVFAATYGRGIFSGTFTEGSDPEGDDDNDGILNGVDNCPETANPGQEDTDDNGVGDACQDTDGDGILDIDDNCPTTSNPDQQDTDGNGVGDACQDTDEDGIMDDRDNCIDTKNPDQNDFNNDGIGDACQDTDEDGFMDNVDNCPGTANVNQLDTDGDGIGDVCQDSDGDGVLDSDDNCVNTANPGQEDADNNGIGDACQDTDEDGIMDDVDNCINTVNPNQTDTNGNGVGDTCDTSYTAQNNISIETISETCENQNDGKIIVNVQQTFVNYTVTIKGNGVDLSEQLTTDSITFEDVTPGTYEVCVKVNDRDDYMQCFEINIAESNPVALRVAKNSQSQDYTVEVTSGTAPYNVYLNGTLIDTFNTSKFNINSQKSGVIQVTTAKACEGEFTTVMDNIFLKQNPVGENIELLLPIDALENIPVIVYDITGKTVLNKTIQKQGNQLSIPFSNFKSGIYILKLGADNTNTFKILK